MKKYEVNAIEKKDSFNINLKSPKFRSNAAQIIAVCIKNTLMFSYGLTLGFPTILIPGLQQPDPNDYFDLSQEAISWIGSINYIFVPIGCAVSGPITQLLGRKKTMLLVNLPFFVAWLMLKFSTSIYLIFVALAITGLSGGLLEAPVITYVAEICQPRLRGMLSSTSSMSVIAGVLIQFLFGTFMHWRTVALTNSAFPIFSFILICFVPESPHWLILKNRLTDARKSIAWVRGWTTLEAIEGEFKDLYKYISKEENKPAINGEQEKIKEGTRWDTIKLYAKKNFLWPYALVSFCFFLCQFTGMTTLQTYAIQIFASLKAPIDIYVATVYLGIAQLTGCIFCVVIVGKWGKRKLNFASLIGTGLCFVVVAAYAYYIGVKHLSPPIQTQKFANTTNTNHDMVSFADTYSWVPMTFLIFSAFVSYMGIRILPWILTGELYNNETRAAGSGLSGAIAYIFGFIANKTFLSLVNQLTLPGVFTFNAALSFIGCILLYVVLPETEGKPLREITDHFNGMERMTNSVRRKQKNTDLSTTNGKANDGFSLDHLAKGSIENHM